MYCVSATENFRTCPQDSPQPLPPSRRKIQESVTINCARNQTGKENRHFCKEKLLSTGERGTIREIHCKRALWCVNSFKVLLCCRHSDGSKTWAKWGGHRWFYFLCICLDSGLLLLFLLVVCVCVYACVRVCVCVLYLLVWMCACVEVRSQHQVFLSCSPLFFRWGLAV